MHILAESLTEGLIGVNETGDIFVCNKKACQIARISEELVMGKKGEEVFPYIPFYQVLREKKSVPEKVIHHFWNGYFSGSRACDTKRELYWCICHASEI